MDVPLDQKWLVELNGNAVLTLEFKVQSKVTKLAIKMPRSQSYATFGGENLSDFINNEDLIPQETYGI
jgi:hypothetical protein